MSLIPEDTFLFPGPSALCYHRSLFLLETHSQASTNLCDKRQGQLSAACCRASSLLCHDCLMITKANNCLKRKNKCMAYETVQGWGHLWLWLDTQGSSPSPRACFRSSLCLLSSRLVLVLALFVESWQYQLYPQFLRFLFLS